MKKMLVFLMMGLMVFGMVAGVTAAEPQSEIVSLTLAESINKALEPENNYNLQQAKLKVDKAADDLKNNKKSKQDILDKRTIPEYITEDTLYKLEMGIRLAEMGLTLAEKKIDLVKNQSIISVKQKYFNVLKSQSTVDNYSNMIKVAQEQLRFTKARFKQGLVAQKDVLDAEVLMASQQALLAGAQRQLEIAELSLKRELGLDLDTKIKLITSLEYTPEKFDRNKMLAAALSVSYDIMASQEMAKSYDDLVKLGDKRAWGYTATYDEVIYNRDLQKINLELAHKNIELLVYQTYAGLLGSQDQILILEKQVTQAKEGLRLARLQNQAGLINSVMVSLEANKVNDAQARYLSALYDNHVAVTKIEHSIYEPTGFTP